MNSCIYNGVVNHTRFKPVKHFLKYNTFSIFIDLDELEILDKKNNLLATANQTVKLIKNFSSRIYLPIFQ